MRKLLNYLFAPERKTVVIVGGVVILVSTCLAFIYMRQASLLQQQLLALQSPPRSTTETSRIVSRLAEHILLPTDTPLIYTVSDMKEVKAAYGDFFQEAALGDKVVIFKTKAIIYRESGDLIVNVGPLVLITPTPTPTKKK